jgi:hypothetical protein
MAMFAVDERGRQALALATMATFAVGEGRRKDVEELERKLDNCDR